MEGSNARLAKLIHPRLHDAVPRPRLFQRLDEARRRGRAICVVGPPGAGKTTLVASWLDAGRIPSLWFQLDAGDADLPTFIHYLARAADEFGTSNRHLPHLTADYVHDVPGFMRRFFRDLWERMPAPATIVFDNHQDVASGSPLHDAIVIAIDEAPGDACVVLVSRRELPPAYARPAANRAIAHVDWEDLRFTLDEARAVIARRRVADDATVEWLHSMSAGWAAGLVLLTEDSHRRAAERLPVEAVDPHAAFDYFADQIFDRAPAILQRFLMLTAFLPRITVLGAERLTGEADAARILDGLYRRHLFTHRRPGDVPTFQYHNLFELFLKPRACAVIDPEDIATLVTRCGEILEDEGLSDEAFESYREAGAAAALVRLATGHAERLLAQGRGATLRAWIEAIPHDVAAREPRLAYWVGMSLIPERPETARGILEAAHAGLRAAGRHRDAVLAACGVIEAMYREWSGFLAIPGWLVRIEELFDDDDAIDTSAAELRICSTLILAMTYAQPGHPRLPELAVRVQSLLRSEDLGVGVRLVAGTYLLAWCSLAMRLYAGRQVIALVEPLLGHADATPAAVVGWHARAGFFEYLAAAPDAGLARLEQARAIGETHGLVADEGARVVFHHYRLLLALERDNAVAARQALTDIGAAAWRDRPMDRWGRAASRAEWALAFGDPREALACALASVPVARETGIVTMLVRSLMLVAMAATDCSEPAHVEASLAEVRRIVAGTCLEFLQCDAAILEARARVRFGEREAGLAHLRDALALARRTGHAFQEHGHRRALGEVVELALVHGIHADYAAELVRRFALRPPASRPEAWPWPVRIHTLGRFEIEVDGRPLAFGAKAPRKLLALLGAIVAFGGTAVSQRRIIDALWPDEDGDAAQKALGVALLRLRRLLGLPAAIVTADQTISLDTALCWVDVRALESRLAEARAAASEDATAAERIADAAVRLYRGPLLPTFDEESWAVLARTRTITGLVERVEWVANGCESRGRPDRAFEWYRRGIAIDDTVEAFHQGVMRCCLALDRPADGIAAFRRLRQTLSIVLNVAPSPATEALARELRARALGEPSPGVSDGDAHHVGSLSGRSVEDR